MHYPHVYGDPGINKPIVLPVTLKYSTGGSRALRRGWTTKKIPGQPGSCSETLSQKKKNQ
jgi:hypothetical protein